MATLRIKIEETKMAANNKWTMEKTLGVSEMNGTLVLKQDEVKVKENLLNKFSRNKLRKMREDEENGVNITLFDAKRKESVETTIKKSATGDGFHIKWEIEGKGYVVGDEILMRWSRKKEQLIYMVLQIGASRIHPHNFLAASNPSQIVDASLTRSSFKYL